MSFLLQVKIPNTMNTDLKVLAAKTNDNKTDLVRIALSEYLERRRGEKI